MSDDIKISQYMVNATGDSDQNGEFIEIFNTLDRPINLQGMKIEYKNVSSCSGGTTRSVTLPATSANGKSPVIPARGTIVFMRRYSSTGTSCSDMISKIPSESSSLFGFGGVLWFNGSGTGSNGAENIFTVTTDAMKNGEGCITLYNGATVIYQTSYSSSTTCVSRKMSIDNSGNANKNCVYISASGYNDDTTPEPGDFYGTPTPCGTPSVSSTTPSNGDTDISVGDNTITINFSDAMDISTATCCGSTNNIEVSPSQIGI